MVSGEGASAIRRHPGRTGTGRDGEGMGWERRRRDGGCGERGVAGSRH